MKTPRPRNRSLRLETLESRRLMAGVVGDPTCSDVHSAEAEAVGSPTVLQGTASVPDGGTVLVGGIPRAEPSTEVGGDKWINEQTIVSVPDGGTVLLGGIRRAPGTDSSHGADQSSGRGIPLLPEAVDLVIEEMGYEFSEPNIHFTPEPNPQGGAFADGDPDSDVPDFDPELNRQIPPFGNGGFDCQENHGGLGCDCDEFDPIEELGAKIDKSREILERLGVEGEWGDGLAGGWFKTNGGEFISPHRLWDLLSRHGLTSGEWGKDGSYSKPGGFGRMSSQELREMLEEDGFPLFDNAPLELSAPMDLDDADFVL